MHRRRRKVPQSVLEAIKEGVWDYEPADADSNEYEATEALPGTDEKLNELARRVERGLPLWHPQDRRTFNDRDDE
jgi:hypothetical protein